MVNDEFIGAGWAFPLRTDSAGGIALVTRERKIEESIRLILGTAYGERPMRPEFGCGIHDLVFARADDETAARVSYEVRAALVRWEPRIDVVSVEVALDDADKGVLYIDVSFRATDSNDPRNLVFPFYTIPEERLER
jgi:phage baseplate assembly protein W